MNEQHPTQTDPWEREMTSEFDRRVRDLHEAPLSLDAVKGQAGRIRRTRRAVVAGGILAAAAVLVPVAVVGSSGAGDDTAPDPVAPATTATSVEQPPAPAYVEGREFHAADSTVYDLPVATYSEVVRLGDRLVAYRWDEQAVSGVVDVLGADGAVVDTYLATQDPVVSVAGDLVAFVAPRGEVRVLWDGGDRTLSGGFDGWMPQAVDGGPDCSAPTSDCRVFLSDGSGEEDPVAVAADGTVSTPAPGVVRVNDSDGDGHLAVISSVTDYGACGGVVEEGGRTLFDQCDVRPETFSPDGRHVVGSDATSDGIGADLAVVLDATTGETVGTIDSVSGFINRAVWVDDDTVAASVFDETTQTWSVLTLTIGDDAPETLLGPVAGSMDVPAYRLVGGL